MTLNNYRLRAVVRVNADALVELRFYSNMTERIAVDITMSAEDAAELAQLIVDQLSARVAPAPSDTPEEPPV